MKYICSSAVAVAPNANVKKQLCKSKTMAANSKLTASAVATTKKMLVRPDSLSKGLTWIDILDAFSLAASSTPTTRSNAMSVDAPSTVAPISTITPSNTPEIVTNRTDMIVKFASVLEKSEILLCTHLHAWDLLHCNTVPDCNPIVFKRLVQKSIYNHIRKNNINELDATDLENAVMYHFNELTKSQTLAEHIMFNSFKNLALGKNGNSKKVVVKELYDSSLKDEFNTTLDILNGMLIDSNKDKAVDVVVDDNGEAIGVSARAVAERTRMLLEHMAILFEYSTDAPSINSIGFEMCNEYELWELFVRLVDLGQWKTLSPYDESLSWKVYWENIKPIKKYNIDLLNKSIENVILIEKNKI